MKFWIKDELFSQSDILSQYRTHQSRWAPMSYDMSWDQHSSRAVGRMPRILPWTMCQLLWMSCSYHNEKEQKQWQDGKKQGLLLWHQRRKVQKKRSCVVTWVDCHVVVVHVLLSCPARYYVFRHFLDFTRQAWRKWLNQDVKSNLNVLIIYTIIMSSVAKLSGAESSAADNRQEQC